MKEKIIQRGKEQVVEVRSDAGKLLFVKTKEGYELKCPRSKQICLVPYRSMLSDCLKCFDEATGEKIAEAVEYIVEKVSVKTR